MMITMTARPLSLDQNPAGTNPKALNDPTNGSSTSEDSGAPLAAGETESAGAGAVATVLAAGVAESLLAAGAGESPLVVAAGGSPLAVCAGGSPLAFGAFDASLDAAGGAPLSVGPGDASTCSIVFLLG
jgi:hypothetical protein